MLYIWMCTLNDAHEQLSRYFLNLLPNNKWECLIGTNGCAQYTIPHAHGVDKPLVCVLLFPFVYSVQIIAYIRSGKLDWMLIDLWFSLFRESDFIVGKPFQLNANYPSSQSVLEFYLSNFRIWDSFDCLGELAFRTIEGISVQIYSFKWYRNSTVAIVEHVQNGFHRIASRASSTFWNRTCCLL